jgi:hypothetical protein
LKAATRDLAPFLGGPGQSAAIYVSRTLSCRRVPKIRPSDRIVAAKHSRQNGALLRAGTITDSKAFSCDCDVSQEV